MDAILWLAAVVVLLVIEIATLGLTTIWFAGGALIAGIAAVAGAGSIVQFVIEKDTVVEIERIEGVKLIVKKKG